MVFQVDKDRSKPVEVEIAEEFSSRGS